MAAFFIQGGGFVRMCIGENTRYQILPSWALPKGALELVFFFCLSEMASSGRTARFHE